MRADRTAKSDQLVNQYSSSVSVMRSTQNGPSTPSGGYLDGIKQKAEQVLKKMGVMNAELSKIYMSLQNCVTLTTDWRYQARPEEAEKLKNLSIRAQRSLETKGIQYDGILHKIKDELNEATTSWISHVQGLVSRLESISTDCKNEITMKAGELLTIKNEMDLFDPAKRIPISLKSYTNKSGFN